MNEALKLSLAFAGGAAVGVLCTWQFFLSKKEKEVQEEIEICREVYAKHFEDGLSKNYEAVAVCRICELYSIPAYVDGNALTVNRRNTPPQDLLGTVF